MGSLEIENLTIAQQKLFRDEIGSIVILDAPLATVNTANTVVAAGPILGKTTDDQLVVKYSETAGVDGWEQVSATISDIIPNFNIESVSGPRLENNNGDLEVNGNPVDFKTDTRTLFINSGETYDVGSSDTSLTIFLLTSSPVAEYTVNLRIGSDTFEHQLITIFTNEGITNFNIIGPSGIQFIGNLPTTLPTNSFVQLIYLGLNYWGVVNDNPTLTEIGLGNVDNTSDLNKPISTLTQTALSLKLDKEILFANVKDFGAVGDGATDDSAAIQAAADTNPSILYFPNGTYNCNFTIGGRVRISGQSNSSTILRANNSANPVITVNQSFSGIAGGRVFENVKIEGVSNLGHGISITNGNIAEWIVRDCIFEDCDHAISFDSGSAILGQFIRNAFYANNYDVYLGGSGAHNINVFERNRHRFNKKASYYVTGGSGNIWKANDISEFEGFAFILLGDSAEFQHGGSEWNYFEGGWFESQVQLSQVTLDIEGLVDTKFIWVQNNKLTTASTISGGVLFDAARIKMSHFRSASLAVYTFEAINESIVEIDVITGDQAGTRVISGDETSIVTIKSGHIAGSGKNRCQIWESDLPSVFREDLTNEAINTSGQFIGAGGTLPTYSGTLMNWSIANVNLADTAAQFRFNVPLDVTKWYVSGFAAKSNSGSSEDFYVRLLSTGNTAFSGTINAKVDGFRYYWLMFPGIDSSDPISYRFYTNNAGGCNISIGLFQYVEFSLRGEAENWISSRSYAVPTIS